MGTLLKFILFTVIFFWLFSRVANFFVRMFVGNQAGSRSQFDKQEPPHRTKKGDINIDYMPNLGKQKGKKGKEGEYIDFEEVKD